MAELILIIFCGLFFYFLCLTCIEDKTILHSVNGRFPGGHLISIMGPSGAGKSTLLDVLSGFRVEGVQGSVYVNGRIRTLGKILINPF